MDMIALVSGFNLGDMNMENLVVAVVALCAGWVIPQPAFMDPVVNFVCEKLKLERFHKDGNPHADQHEEVAEEKDEEVK